MAVSVADAVVDGFKNISGYKMKNRYMICKLEGAEIVVEKMGDKTENFDDFVASL